MTPNSTTLATICVPTYNSETTIGETLQSIVTQTHRHLVIKIFDNASTDHTLDIARSFAARDSRIKIFENTENIGAEGNFNRCLSAAEGDFTAIFHADDIYEPTMVEQQIEYLSQNSDAVAVATHASVIDKDGVETGRRFLPPFNSLGLAKHRSALSVSFDFKDLLSMTLQFGNFITCPSVMARSSIYRDKIRIWNGSEYRTSADLDVWLRLAKIGRFGLLTTPLMRYRESQASFTVRETKRRFTEHDILRVLKHYVSDVSNESASLRQIKFHELKDVAARRLNILMARRRDLPFPRFEGSVVQLIPLAFRSRYQLKFFLISSLIFGFTEVLRVSRIHR